ncbi:hypothetical protein CIPAW_08G170300 [Carya illinoinensis]|uniref:Stress regulated protein n=1 Tax=Carya illinoinensis TaxID=32201 RepID=A0A8T1PZC1_CARIL|nr:hypothetical protein CIPAW_08G170300 [Carya illinoinensis]
MIYPFIFYGLLRTSTANNVLNMLGDVGVSRRQALEQLDKKLAEDDDRAALSLAKDLQGKPGGLRCFGGARQVPQTLYSLDELRLNGIEASSLLSPVDATFGSIERNLQLAAALGGLAAWNVLGFGPQQVLYFSLGLLFLWTLDSVSFDGGVGSLVLDTIGHTFSQKYHNRVVQHEAGHFLIAYLVGILPKGYTLTSLEALKKEGSLNVQAGTTFVDFEFVEEVSFHVPSQLKAPDDAMALLLLSRLDLLLLSRTNCYDAMALLLGLVTSQLEGVIVYCLCCHRLNLWQLSAG